jgi:uncharacterized protein YlaI
MAEEFEDLSFSETGCEVRVQGEWALVELSQALKLDPVRIKRCPECHGQVRLIKASRSAAAHFEHYEPHTGCASGDCFDGLRRPHPKALR